MCHLMHEHASLALKLVVKRFSRVSEADSKIHMITNNNKFLPENCVGNTILSVISVNQLISRLTFWYLKIWPISQFPLINQYTTNS